MKLQRWGQTGTVRIEEEGEFNASRVDRYAKSSRWWWGRLEEIEIWVLPDGRQVRASRCGPGEWQLRWRAA